MTKTDKDRWSDNMFFNAEGERVKTLVIDLADGGVEIRLDGKVWFRIDTDGDISSTMRRSARQFLEG